MASNRDRKAPIPRGADVWPANSSLCSLNPSFISANILRMAPCIASSRSLCAPGTFACATCTSAKACSKPLNWCRHSRFLRSLDRRISGHPIRYSNASLPSQPPQFLVNPAPRRRTVFRKPSRPAQQIQAHVASIALFDGPQQLFVCLQSEYLKHRLPDRDEVLASVRRLAPTSYSGHELS